MVVVFSCGRTGTNLILEVLTGSSILTPSQLPEDKALFLRDVVYPHNYLTKTDTVYCKDYGKFGNFMKKNPNSKVIWTVRHPYDTAMSKIVRGYRKADDGDLKGCVKDMHWMAYLYTEATSEFGNRIRTVKMEDVIIDVEKEAKGMCEFLNLSYERKMKYPYLRMRHTGKKERYPNSLDKKEINKYHNWKTAYSGFLTTVDFNMEDLFNKIEGLIGLFGYDN